jgi:hypothetical protein
VQEHTANIASGIRRRGGRSVSPLLFIASALAVLNLRMDGALVSFDEESIASEDLAGIGDAVRAALARFQ